MHPNDEAHPPLEPWVSELPPGVFPEEPMTLADVVYLHRVRCSGCGDVLWGCDCDEGRDHHGTDDDVCDPCRKEAAEAAHRTPDGV